MLYISSQTQKIHTSRECSMTRKNKAFNLPTDRDAEYLAAHGYVGCKRCDAHQIIENAR
jgi:hypothetical protein